MKADAVFQGGGVKGIGLLGGLSVMEKTWEWQNIAGTSAGAIVAAFTAMGMKSADVRNILQTKVDLKELMDEGWEDKFALNLRGDVGLPFILGHFFSIWKDFGVFEGKRFIELMEQLTPPEFKTFAGLRYGGHDAAAEADEERYRYKLQVVASDITAHRMLVLPQDIKHFKEFDGDPDKLPVSHALRMSMSIPIFFEPYQLTDKQGKKHYIVDGGLLSNFPIWLFDAPVGVDPEWPTFGFKLISSDPTDGLEPWPSDVVETNSVAQFFGSIWQTVFSALDKRYISERHWARTVPISDMSIPTTKFEITPEERDLLWDSGIKAATEFMAAWGDPQAGFDAWKAKYRGDVEAAQLKFAASVTV
jgi:NTE family protein